MASSDEQEPQHPEAQQPTDAHAYTDRVGISCCKKKAEKELELYTETAGLLPKSREIDPSRYVLEREEKARKRTNAYTGDELGKTKPVFKTCGSRTEGGVWFLRPRDFCASTAPTYPVQLNDSSILCVGIAPKKVFFRKFSPSFMYGLEWSLRTCCALLLATLPAFIDYFRENTDAETCHNTVYECVGWESEGQCDKNPVFMSAVCTWSCNTNGCRETVSFTPGENFIPSYDPTFCGIAFVMAFGFTAGESHRFLWEIVAGSIVSALIPQLAINTFGANVPAVCGFAAVWVFFICVMPIDAMTKKFSLGMCLHYMMVRADWKFKEWEWDDEMTLYHVAKTGIWGAFCALLGHLLPFPRGSTGEAKRQLNQACSNSMLGMSFLVKSFLYGQTKQERVKAMRYIDEVTVNLQEVEQLLSYGFWEPYQQRNIHKYKTLISTLHKLRGNLYGMQQALVYWDNDMNRKLMHDKVRESLLQMAAASSRCLDGAMVLATEDKVHDPYKRRLVVPEDSWESVYGLDDDKDDDAPLSGPNRAATAQEKFQRKLTGDHRVKPLSFMECSKCNHVYDKRKDGPSHPTPFEDLGDVWQCPNHHFCHGYKQDYVAGDTALLTGYSDLRRYSDTFDLVFSAARGEAAKDPLRGDENLRADSKEMEKDQWMHTFLCSFVSYCDSLLEFPEEFAESWEAKVNESKASQFVPDSKIVSVYFQKRFLLSGFKTSACVFIAIIINAFIFNYEYEAPVIICYVMAGHTGGSYSVTITRSLGVLGGMILGFMVMIASECSKFWLCVGYLFVVSCLAYIRRSSVQHSYAAFVASIVTTLLVLRECSEDIDEQYILARQLILSVLIMGVVELVFSTNSLFFLRKQVHDTFVEAREAFDEMFQTHLTDSWEELRRKAYVAQQYEQGVFDEYRPPVREKKLVDNSLWRNLPLSLNTQEILMEQCRNEPAFWRPPFPITAYDQLISLSRHAVLQLTVLHNHMARSERDRKGRDVEALQLIDGVKKELSEMRIALNEAMTELAVTIRSDVKPDFIPDETDDMNFDPAGGGLSYGDKKAKALAAGRLSLTRSPKFKELNLKMKEFRQVRAHHHRNFRRAFVAPLR
jgi:rubredoxin